MISPVSICSSLLSDLAAPEGKKACGKKLYVVFTSNEMSDKMMEA